MASIYSTLRWQLARARAIARDGSRCTVSRISGVGSCSPGPLHVHHVIPITDGGDPYDLDNLATACASHHGLWEPLRRLLLDRVVNRGQDAPVTCPHQHRNAEARRLCEARLNRSRRRESAAA